MENTSGGTGANAFLKSLLIQRLSDGDTSPSVPLPPPIYQSPRNKFLWFQQFIYFPQSPIATA